MDGWMAACTRPSSVTCVCLHRMAVAGRYRYSCRCAAQEEVTEVAGYDAHTAEVPSEAWTGSVCSSG